MNNFYLAWSLTQSPPTPSIGTTIAHARPTIVSLVRRGRLVKTERKFGSSRKTGEKPVTGTFGKGSIIRWTHLQWLEWPTQVNIVDLSDFKFFRKKVLFCPSSPRYYTVRGTNLSYKVPLGFLLDIQWPKWKTRLNTFYPSDLNFLRKQFLFCPLSPRYCTIPSTVLSNKVSLRCPLVYQWEIQWTRHCQLHRIHHQWSYCIPNRVFFLWLIKRQERYILHIIYK